MQCDVYRNKEDPSGQIPYLLDVQADLLADLDTRAVIPLIRVQAFGRRASRLHPVFTIETHRVVMATHLIAAVRKRPLGTAITSLINERDIIISALDVLWSGV